MFKKKQIFIAVIATIALSMLFMSACNNSDVIDTSQNSSTSETSSAASESTATTTTKRSESSTIVKPEATAAATNSETTISTIPKTVVTTIPETTSPPSSDVPRTGTLPDEASAESPETINTSETEEQYVKFKIVDSDGNPIPNVIISINYRADMTRYSDKNGIINHSFHRVGLGKHTVEILETYKINKSITYEINVESFPAEFTLIWDFGNPDEIVYQPKSTATLIFRDKDGKPVKGHLVCASYFLVMSENGEGFDRLEEIGRLDENGQVVWKEPPPETAEIQVLDDQNNLYLYDLTLSHDLGNTDYYFYWQEGTLKE